MINDLHIYSQILMTFVSQNTQENQPVCLNFL